MTQEPTRRWSPVRRLSALGRGRIPPESVHWIRNASILWADYGRIVRDFPHYYRELAGRGRDHLERLIDDWLLANGAVISEPHVHANEVHEPVATQAPTRKGYRPPGYGRAVVVEASRPRGESDDNAPLGLLDLKGVGVHPERVPVDEPQANGLLALPDAIREIVNQRLVEAAMSRAGVHVFGIPLYGLISTGIAAAVGSFDRRLPCTILVRAAHARPRQQIPTRKSPDYAAKIQLELLLRAFGLTSCGVGSTGKIRRSKTGRYDISDSPAAQFMIACKGTPFELDSRRLSKVIRSLRPGLSRGETASVEVVNIQTSDRPQVDPLRVSLVDFGHYVPAIRFDNPFFIQCRDRPGRWGTICWPGGADWMQPLEGIALRSDLSSPRPVADEHRRGAREEHYTGLDAFIAELCNRCCSGKLSKRGFGKLVDGFVQSAFPGA